MASPSVGSLTFLLTDIDGSTRILARAGARYPELVATHREIIAAAADRHGGVAIPTLGDACLATFSTATAAVRAAVDAQRAMRAHDWGTGEALQVRIGIHTGQAVQHDGEYFGLDLHRAARIADAGHGGQVLVSATARADIAAHPPSDVRLLDLGLHRLRDLEAPVRLYQVESVGLSRGFPPLRTLRSDAHNLPVATSPLIGRTREVGEITELLIHRRLVTLTGPGGVGKTRLALHVGANAVDAYPDGVWLIELARVRDAGSVPAAIAEPLGLDLSDSLDPSALLAEALREQATLLILDNFEHVIDAAPVVGAVLAECARVHVLVTSREHLRLADEQSYRVSPLSLTSDAVGPRAAADAVTLFVERARTHDPAFAPSVEDLRAVAEICELIDGLPLAIELAAAQTRLLPVRAVRDRLRHGLDTLSGGPRDRPLRHRALRSTIAWSYRLLQPDEQRLFARLSVFRGGRTLEAVRAVCTEDLEIDPFAGIAALVDKSMLQRRIGSDGDVTWVLLELLHEYAKEALADSGDEAAIRRRHAMYFADLAERADAGMLGTNAVDWERVLNNQLENFRSALEWAFASGDAQQGVRIAAALNLFWYWGGPHDDGRRWVRLALDHGDLLDEHTRGRLHTALGFFGFADGDMVVARRHWESALKAFRTTADDPRTCMALGWIAVSHAGDPSHHDHAERLADEAVALARSVNDHSRLVADALTCKGEIARLGGEDAVAHACYRDALAIVETMGDDRYIASLQTNLAYVAGHRGDFHAALQLNLAALEASWKHGRRSSVAWHLGEIAGPEIGLGRPERAARLVGASDAALARIGVTRQPTDQPEYDRTVAQLAEILGQDQLDDLLAESAQMSLDDAVDYALASKEASRHVSPRRRGG